MASVWEVVIKYAVGKIPLPEPPAEYLPRQRAAHQIADMPLTEAALIHLAKLPPLHHDPFDRIIVAQVLQHYLTILTVDDVIRDYPAPCLPNG